MGVAIAAKVKQSRAASSAILSRKVANHKPPKAAKVANGKSAVATKSVAKSPKVAKATKAQKAAAANVRAAELAGLPESYTDKVRQGNRTKLAENAGKLFEAIYDFIQDHKLPRGLKRRLDNCAQDLWDLEIEEDGKSGALEVAFGEAARSAGKSIPLEEALAKMKAQL